MNLYLIVFGVVLQLAITCALVGLAWFLYRLRFQIRYMQTLIARLRTAAELREGELP